MYVYAHMYVFDMCICVYAYIKCAQITGFSNEEAIDSNIVDAFVVKGHKYVCVCTYVCVYAYMHVLSMHNVCARHVYMRICMC